MKWIFVQLLTVTLLGLIETYSDEWHEWWASQWFEPTTSRLPGVIDIRTNYAIYIHIPRQAYLRFLKPLNFLWINGLYIETHNIAFKILCKYFDNEVTEKVAIYDLVFWLMHIDHFCAQGSHFIWRWKWILI